MARQVAEGGVPRGREPKVGQRRVNNVAQGLLCPLDQEAESSASIRHEDGRAVFKLRKAAIEVGGPDNITMALVRLGS